MLTNFLTKCFRSYYAGNSSQFIFTKEKTPVFPEEKIQNIHLYIHIPFCQNTCPYCPYNKIELQLDLADSYFIALHREINLYRQALGEISIKSIYFGGGSPAILPDKIVKIIDHLKQCFKIEGDICIELNPNDCNIERLNLLKAAGIKVVSIGIQSFQDKYLSIIGRNYNSIQAENALIAAKSIFDVVNVDLMFALPEQNKHNIITDIEKAIELNADQITTYPLFTFPYSAVGRYRKISQVKMPNLRQRKEQYYTIYDKLTSNDFKQASVWSFKKSDNRTYSSVTREGYLGLGAGAGTHFSNGFFLNTFSVYSYIDSLNENRYPTALKFKLNDNLDKLFWLYWRFYDSRIPIADFNLKFSENYKVKRLISFFTKTGLLLKSDYEYILTRKGSFWLHLGQNYFSLGYINKIWSKALKNDFPEKIHF